MALETERTDAERNVSKMNYYARPVGYGTGDYKDLPELIKASRTKLHALSKGFINLQQADNTQEIEAKIKSIKNYIDLYPDSSTTRPELAIYLKILQDLNKINQLSSIDIPQDDDTVQHYMVLNENLSGVTKKVALIHLDTLIDSLRTLCQQADLSLDNYSEKQKQWKLLQADAMLKLPKHDRIEEVQREAIALNISKILGLRTTDFTYVSYSDTLEDKDGKPALFIPFDDIELLDQYTHGKIVTAYSIESKQYHENSTIKPVSVSSNEGLQADCYINELGTALGLMYLCNDPDAVGGYCQNKALIDAQQLYIFDQVLTPSPSGLFFGIDHLLLDSSLSTRSSSLGSFSRHTSGRNFSLIEDASISTKYQSLLHVYNNREKINNLLESIKSELSEEENNLRNTGQVIYNERIENRLTDLVLLKSDLERIQTSITNRMQVISKILMLDIIDEEQIKHSDLIQAKILEKLIHLPVLFTDDGRAFKHPWTKDHTNPVTSLIKSNNKDIVSISFAKPVPEEVWQYIRDRGAYSLECNEHVITMDTSDFETLAENMLYPEASLELDPETDYLNENEVYLLYQAYQDFYHFVKNVVVKYATIKLKSENNPQLIVENIINTELNLRNALQHAENKGLVMHVLKKFYFDAQIQLQKAMSPPVPTMLNEAFNAALKLDCVADFTKVVLAYVQNEKEQPYEFIEFLRDCIKLEHQAIDYKSAQASSSSLQDQAELLINILQGKREDTSRISTKYKKLLPSDPENTSATNSPNISNSK